MYILKTINLIKSKLSSKKQIFSVKLEQIHYLFTIFNFVKIKLVVKIPFL